MLEHRCAPENTALEPCCDVRDPGLVPADTRHRRREECTGVSGWRSVRQKADPLLTDGTEWIGALVLPLSRLVTLLQTATGPVARSE